MEEYTFTKKDFKIDWFSGTGKGGQKKNKSKSYCRITHIETGLVAQGMDHREPSKNQHDAFTKLAKMIVDHYKVEHIKELNLETIRTYHAVRNEVRDKASDHRQEFKDVLEDPDEMIKARKRAIDLPDKD